MNRILIFPTKASRAGTTLIEVLLGLVLLATLLASAITARGRFLRQWSDANRKLQLTDAADRLMNRLSSGTPDSLIGAGGAVPDVPGATWRTSLLADPIAASLQTIKVRLEMTDSRPPGTGITVEFLVHRPPPTTKPARRS